MKSKYLSITIKDVLKGAIVAVLTSIATAVIPILQTGEIPGIEQLHTILIAGVGAGVAYLLKNFFTNSNDQILTREPIPLIPPIGPAKSGEIEQKQPVTIKIDEIKAVDGTALLPPQQEAK